MRSIIPGIQRQGLREKKYFCELEESFFEKEEWYLRLMLIGEDRLAHNLATRDRGRCISFNGISEDFKEWKMNDGCRRTCEPSADCRRDDECT